MAKKKGTEPEVKSELDEEELFNEGEKKVLKEAEETEKKVIEEAKKNEKDVLKQMQGDI